MDWRAWACWVSRLGSPWLGYSSRPTPTGSQCRKGGQHAFVLAMSVPRGGETARSAMSRRGDITGEHVGCVVAWHGPARDGDVRDVDAAASNSSHSERTVDPDPASAAEIRNVSGAVPRCTDSGSMVDLAGEQSTGLVARAGSGVTTPGASVGHRRPGAAGRVTTYCPVAARHPAQGWRVRARRRTSHGTEAMAVSDVDEARRGSTPTGSGCRQSCLDTAR